MEEAVCLGRNVLHLRPQGHPDRARSLLALAHYLQARFKRSAVYHLNGLQEILNLYSQVSHASQIVSLADLEYSKGWIQVAEEWEHSSTVSAYETFLCLTAHHLATLASLPQHLALLRQMTTSTAADAFSACVRHDNHVRAVELLEHGRSAFWSQLFRLCSPLDEVLASGDAGKKLADRFGQLASLLRTVHDIPRYARLDYDRVCHLNGQLQGVVAEIRKLPGLSRFLFPPLFSDLQIAAFGGPVVVVSASQYSSDALVILPHRDPIHIALSMTKARISELSSDFHFLMSGARYRNVTRGLLVLLRELWDVVVSPIAQVLREFCPSRSRIWWYPTAKFSLLPLHAASSFRKGEPRLSDLYISSYTPTLTALIRARQQRSSNPSLERHRFLVVGHAQAPGQRELVSVNTEMSTISHRIGSVATLTCVQDQNTTMAKVAEELTKNAFVHLACHGVQDRTQPFQSGFVLHDELLKVEDIMRHDLQHAEFAYLSACHSVVRDEESSDEVIHLPTAMQFAGFRSVIGTIWAVDDAHTNKIASRFYEYMLDGSGVLDYTRAALALHRTMISLRSSEIPLDQWILYVHVGA